MGCVDSKTSESKAEKVDHTNVPADNPDYPPADVPTTEKADVYDKDKMASLWERIAKMPKGTDSRYSTLLKYLSQGATKEAHHVLAIYLWMKEQDYNNPSLDQERPASTPRGYMKMIKEGQGTLTTFFTILCRTSGIPCVMVDGLGKDDTYTIGDLEQDLYSQWCAVHVDGEWHLSHIEWAISGETKDAAQSNTNTHDPDFFFLTDPDVFSTFCFPEDSRWQLLKQPFSKREFFNLPNLRPAFFSLGMRVISPSHGTAKTGKDKLTVQVAFPKETANEMFLGYEFQFQQDLPMNLNSPQKEQKERRNSMPSSLRRYVFLYQKQCKFLYEIHVPAAGMYLFDIYGKHTDGTQKATKEGLEKLCQFRLVSEIDAESAEVEPLPESPDIPWGPGPNSRRLGLVDPSHVDGYIYIKPGEVRELTFRMKWPIDVRCQLTHNYLPVYQLVEQIEQSVEKDHVRIRVRIPEEGMYALRIYSRDAGSNEFEEACLYLLKQPQKVKITEKYRDKMLRSRLEHHLTEHTSEKELKDAVNVFECYNVPDHGEKKRAAIKLKQYWEVKRELNLAIKGRNPRVLTKWIGKAKKCKYKDDLHEDIHRAELILEYMGKLKGYFHPIARMEQHTMTEIRSYRRPPPVIHEVMTSTYLLLGEFKESVEDWEQVQYLMGKTGKESLQRRILGLRVEDVTLELADESASIIQPYSLQKCRETSTGIGSFYLWCNQFIRDVRQREMQAGEKGDDDQQYCGRETFRDEGNKGHLTTSGKEPVKFKGRTLATIDDHTQHPFAVQQDEEVEDEEKYQKKDDNYNDTNKEIEDERRIYDTGTPEQSREKANKGEQKYEIEKDKNKNGNESPDHIEKQEIEKQEVPEKKFVMSPTKLRDDSKNIKPVSYAGFKPPDIDMSQENTQQQNSNEDTKGEKARASPELNEKHEQEVQEVPQKKFYMNPTKQSEDNSNRLKPVSYAGFKPPDIQN